MSGPFACENTPSVCVVVPWRDGGNWLRRANKVRLENHLRREVQSWPVVFADCEGAWAPGRARNAGVAQTNAEVVVFNDADTLVPGAQMRAAAADAWRQPGLVYAYDLYLRLDEQGRIERELFAPPSFGCVAIRRDMFARLGGFDESFVGWGYEDIAFAQRCQELEPVRRIAGVATHLWHGARRHDDSPVDADRGQVDANRARWAEATTWSTV